MSLEELNRLAPRARRAELAKCCGASAWITRMEGHFPFSSAEALLATAEAVWYRCGEEDWREAFRHHPRIGDLGSLRKKFASTWSWAAGEQAGVQQGSTYVLQQLAQGNLAYEEKFGYIFIVCATGKSAEEMLALLQQRLGNSPEAEIKIAMAEQYKITRIRLEKLLTV